MLSVERNWAAFKKRLFQSRNQSWTESTIVISCSKGADTEKGFGPQVRKSFWKERPESVQAFTSKGSVRRVIIGILPYVKSTSLCKFGDQRLFRHTLADGQRWEGLVALLNESVQVGCVSQDYFAKKSILREEGKLGPNHTVKFTQGTWHHLKIPERKGSIASASLKSATCVRQNSTKEPGRNLATRKMRPQRSIELGENAFQLKIEDKATLYCLSEAWMLAPSSKKPEEREFVVDSGASMHMQSKKDSSSFKLDIFPKSRNPTTVITANGAVQTSEKAQVYVHDLDLFVTLQCNYTKTRLPSCH